MPRVTYVKSARVAKPEHGIAVGDPYYHWSMMVGGRGSKRYSKERPSRSQLTNSSYKSQLYDLVDGAQEGWDSCQDADDVRSKLDDLASSIRDLGEEQRSNKDNMPEGLQESETGQLLETRADSCDSCADELEAIDTEIDEDGTIAELVERAQQEMNDALETLESEA